MKKHGRQSSGVVLLATLLAWALVVSEGGASPTTGAHTLAFYPCYGTGGLTTPAITVQSSGSTILAWVGRGDTNGFTGTVLSDTKNNIYTPLGSIKTYAPPYPGSGEALYAVTSATGGSGWQVTAPMPEGGDEITLAAVEVKNGGVIQDVQWNKVLAPPHTSLSVTTTGAATLVAVWAGDSGANSVTAVPNNGFSIINTQLLSSCDVEAVVATKDVSTAGTYNVTWTATPTQGAHMWLVAVQSEPVPVLQASITGGKVVLSWPAPANGYGLEVSSNLLLTNSWVPVTNVPVIVNSQNMVTNVITQPRQYYRLKK